MDEKTLIERLSNRAKGITPPDVETYKAPGVEIKKVSKPNFHSISIKTDSRADGNKEAQEKIKEALDESCYPFTNPFTIPTFEDVCEAYVNAKKKLEKFFEIPDPQEKEAELAEENPDEPVEEGPCDEENYEIDLEGKELEEDLEETDEDAEPAEEVPEDRIDLHIHECEEQFGDVCSDNVRFLSIIDEMYETFKKKNHDYGSSFDKTWDKYGFTSLLCRLSDKLNRLDTLTNNTAEVKTESVEDTLLDLANYAILGVMKLRK